MASKNQNIAAQAAALFTDKLTSNRLAVLEQYRTVLTLPGDAKKGHAIYQKNCSVCHRLFQEGHAVGPDLVAVVTKPPEYLLIGSCSTCFPRPELAGTSSDLPSVHPDKLVRGALQQGCLMGHNQDGLAHVAHLAAAQGLA